MKSEALLTVGHEILNHVGRRIRVTERTLDALDVRGYLHRNKESGIKQISAKNFLVFLEVERETHHFYELGDDCSGPNQVVCHCEKCKGLDPYQSPNLADMVVGDIKIRRKRL